MQYKIYWICLIIEIHLNFPLTKSLFNEVFYVSKFSTEPWFWISLTFKLISILRKIYSTYQGFIPLLCMYNIQTKGFLFQKMCNFISADCTKMKLFIYSNISTQNKIILKVFSTTRKKSQFHQNVIDKLLAYLQKFKSFYEQNTCNKKPV